MYLASKLRTVLVGESLIVPPQRSPWRLFLYELSINRIFALYVALLLLTAVLVIYLLCKKRMRHTSTVMLYIVGFMLIYTSFCLQKISEINMLLRSSVKPKEESTAERTESFKDAPGNENSFFGLLIGAKHSFHGMRLSGLRLGEDLRSGGALRESSGRRIDRCKEKAKKTEIAEDSMPTKKANPNVAHVIVEESRPKEETYRHSGRAPSEEGTALGPVDTHMLSTIKFRSTQSRGAYTNEKERYLRRLLEVFEFKVGTDQSLQSYAANLSKVQKQVEYGKLEFSKALSEFLKEASKIDTELLSFDVSIKHLDSLEDELNTEIAKFFAPIPTTKIHYEVPVYLNVLIRNYASRGAPASGRLGPIIRYEVYVKVVLFIQTLCCLALFIAILVHFDPLSRILKPTVVVCLLLTALFNLMLLMDAQMLDRNCVSGAVEGCRFSQSLVDRTVNNPKTSEMMSRFEELDAQLSALIKDSDDKASALKSHIENIVSEDVAYKALVFNNLFDKLIFIEEDFDHLTGGKADKGRIYRSVHKMREELENIMNDLKQTRYRDTIDLFASESAFGFWLKTQKESALNGIKKVMEMNVDKRSSMPAKWCFAALQNVCYARDAAEDLFALIFIACPVFLFLFLM
jgi:hypothetical protein